MLTLVGLGLNDERDMTLKGVDACKKSDKVYIELYTGKWNGSMESLNKMFEKDQVYPLKRSDMEENSKKLVDEAKEKNIVVLIQGDPLVATTHSSLLVEAKKAGVTTNIIHNSSIFSAIAETGLHVYKFGATVTIPFMEKTGGKFSKTVYDTIRDNKKLGKHTLCLLDVGQDPGVFMTPNEAMGMLMGMERQFGEGIIEPSQKIVILSNAGGESKVLYDGIESLDSKTVGSTPSVVIVPGDMHFTEEEFLDSFKGEY